MEAILKQLYYGMIHADDTKVVNSDSVEKAIKVIADIEDKMLLLLEGDSKELFELYVSTWDELKEESDVEKFVIGFKTGARITVETLKCNGKEES